MKDVDDINDYVPSILNPRTVRKLPEFSLTQNSCISRCSLSLKRPNGTPVSKAKVNPNKENLPNVPNVIKKFPNLKNVIPVRQDVAEHKSLGFSAVEDLITQINDDSIPSTCDFEFLLKNNEVVCKDNCFKNSPDTKCDNLIDDSISQKSFISISSATELDNADVRIESESTSIKHADKSTVKLSFGVYDCKSLNVNARNGAIKNIHVSHDDGNTNIECELLNNSQETINTDENMNETFPSPLKRTAVAVSIEIKKQKLANDVNTENSKVLILNTNSIEKISHVIINPPNYKFLRRNISHFNNKHEKTAIKNGNAKVDGAKLRQVTIDSFIRKGTDATIDVSEQLGCVNNDGAEEMSRNSGVFEVAKCERVRSSKAGKRECNESPKSAKYNAKRDTASPNSKPEVKTANSDSPSPRLRNDCTSSHSPKKNVESIHFNLPVKSKSNKTSLSPRSIPHHKIVAGTHFAVDAFSYGEIPNVKHYFLTHFHSDHYSGLKKSFNKLLFCSKITADLCISRLGVNPKCIHIINVDETVRIDGVEVAAVDANHCPGALMLVFTLPNGKTLLHTGDFRASPTMESCPVFWNKDIHTIYLDTTYCNPRYDFPTQDQSLEMALYILRQKKMALEKVGKKFSSVLIVCGTYTIGKEKFFTGMSRRVGCAVWACPEKERVLQIVEGRTCSRDPPTSCQLHVVPMRDLTHEKLRSYLDSLQGAFAEVVAFKPSGWENGKNSSVEKDSVTIHGIPYSEHSSFSELIRFVKFLKPKQVVPTVDISGGVKAVQKYFPCPLVYKEESQCQSKVTDYFSIHNRQQVAAVT